MANSSASSVAHPHAPKISTSNISAPRDRSLRRLWRRVPGSTDKEPPTGALATVSDRIRDWLDDMYDAVEEARASGWNFAFPRRRVTNLLIVLAGAVICAALCGIGWSATHYLRPDQSTAVQLIAMVVPVASGLAFVMVAAAAVFSRSSCATSVRQRCIASPFVRVTRPPRPLDLSSMSHGAAVLASLRRQCHPNVSPPVGRVACVGFSACGAEFLCRGRAQPSPTPRSTSGTRRATRRRSCSAAMTSARIDPHTPTIDELGAAADFRWTELDRARRVPQDLHDAAAAAGLFRQLVAPALGGDGRPPLEWFRTGMALARHEASFAWVITQGAAELGWIATGGDPTWAAEVLADPHGASASTVAGFGRLVIDGDHARFGGRWGFNTGSPNATWIGGLALVDGQLTDAGLPLGGGGGCRRRGRRSSTTGTPSACAARAVTRRSSRSRRSRWPGRSTPTRRPPTSAAPTAAWWATATGRSPRRSPRSNWATPDGRSTRRAP